MRFYINEELTELLEGEINNQVAELNELLNKSGASATIERESGRTALCISRQQKNIRKAGRKAIDYSATPLSVVRTMISDLGAEGAAKELGLSKGAMYKRIKRREEEGSQYF